MRMSPLDRIFASRRFRHSWLRLKWLMGKYGPYFQLNDREKMINLAMRFAKMNEIEGDYFEFGVGEGFTLGTAVRLAEWFGLDKMMFYGFDSFKGLPVSSGVFKEGDYAYSPEDAAKNIPRSDRVYLYECWYNVLPTPIKGCPLFRMWNADGKYIGNGSVPVPGTKAAIVWIDCDLYSSTRDALRFVEHYMQDGTIICLDDYYCFRGHPCQGERRAFDNWLDGKNPFYETPWHQFGWHGQSFIIHKD